MKKTIIFLIFFNTLVTTAQNSNIAKFKYEEAEQAFVNEDYKTAITKLAEAEKLFGKVNPPILYLRIMAQNQLLGENPHDQSELLLALKKNCKTYLKDYANLDLGDKYREVYQVSDYLSIYADNLDFFNARAAYYTDPPEYDKAIKLCKKAIDAGDHHAMNLMGLMYLGGKAIGKDEKNGVEWYQKAANKGNVFSITNLGYFYIEGKYVTKDVDKARNLYLQAANKGFPNACEHLGKMYYDGNGVTQNYTEAFEWYQKAADRKSAFCMNQIGLMYELGEGVSRNDTEALNCYKKAAYRGNTTAMFNIGSAYYNGFGVAINYSEALNWYKKAAENNNKVAAMSMYMIGSIYYSHIIKGENCCADALSWYKKSAVLDCKYAFYHLGYMYENSLGTPQDYKEAMLWYLKAADEQDFKAMARIGDLYKEGHGVEKDKKTAKSWQLKAEQAEHANLTETK
jgi:hypothetical protein